MKKFFPFIFVILWSSAFITGKIIVDNASPFLALCIRFFVVALGFFLFSYYLNEKLFPSRKDIFQAFVIGIFFHGIYLGGVFYSASQGYPIGITALIVSLHPVLTILLAIPFLDEKIIFRQWIGVFFGFTGAILVIGIDFKTDFKVIGFFSSIIALIGVTVGTLWQKKISKNLSISVNNIYQALGASIFHLILVILYEEPYINFTNEFVFAMAWQIIAVSFGAFTILMILLKVGTASKTSTLFFLVPPITALMAWFLLDEILTKFDIIGLAMVSLGVYIATNSIKIKKKRIYGR